MNNRIFLLVLLLTPAYYGLGQPLFQNLDFEAANLPTLRSCNNNFRGRRVTTTISRCERVLRSAA